MSFRANRRTKKNAEVAKNAVAAHHKQNTINENPNTETNVLYEPAIFLSHNCDKPQKNIVFGRELFLGVGLCQRRLAHGVSDTLIFPHDEQ